jgi:hypothetical protein
MALLYECLFLMLTGAKEREMIATYQFSFIQPFLRQTIDMEYVLYTYLLCTYLKTDVN